MRVLLIVIGLCSSGLSSDVTSNSLGQKDRTECDEGTFLDGDQCRECTKCNINESETAPCNSTSDRVCECSPGYFRDGQDFQCKKCTECAVGWGASPACTSTRNTVCITCPPGSFSHVESSTKSCQSCTECGEDEFSLQECTAQSDTVCFRYQPKAATKIPSTKECDLPDCTQQNQDMSYLYTVPLYCALLGAIIFGLLIYVILRCRVNKKNASQSELCHKHFLPQYQIVQQVPYSHLQPPPTSAMVYLQSNGKIVTATTKYKDIPGHIRKTIQQSLSQDGSWLKLANCLGFTPSEISQIQHQVEHSNTAKQSPAAVLLSEWIKRDYSTLGVMIHALASINRYDLINLLQNSPKLHPAGIV